MSRKSEYSVLAIVLGAVLPATGQIQQNRIPISPQRVVSAMAQAGWKVRPEQVKFLSQVTSTVGNTWLQVVQVTHWQEENLKVELRCHDPQACLPFYVLVSKGGTADKPGENSATDADGEQPPLEMTGEKPLIKSGDPATLKFASKGLSISMPVICLENGHRGQKIRVASADHRHFYKAEIVGPGLLKATTL